MGQIPTTASAQPMFRPLNSNKNSLVGASSSILQPKPREGDATDSMDEEEAVRDEQSISGSVAMIGSFSGGKMTPGGLVGDCDSNQMFPESTH